MKLRHTMITGLVSSMILALGPGRTSAADPPPGPEGLVGFSGQVRGVVAGKGDHGTVTFKVGRVLKTWKGNKAKRPEALKGRTIPVGPAWVREGEGGKWHPVEKHIRFLRTLKPGEELTLEIRHAERDHFAILELSREQRQRAERSGDGHHEHAVEHSGDHAVEHADEEQRGEHDREIAELRREIERLKAEIRELHRRR